MLSYSIDELLDIAHSALAETEVELSKVANMIAKQKNWREIFEDMKREHPSKDGLLPFYQRAVEEARNFVERCNLVTIPENESLEVVYTPPYLRTSFPLTGLNTTGPYDLEQKGFFYVTPVAEGLSPEEEERILGWPGNYGVLPVVVHETYPGHHLQFSRTQSVSSKISKQFTTSLFAEGWALYCEELMHEQGFYPHKKTRLYQLFGTLFRILRVLLDVKLHTQGMTLELGADLLMTQAKLDKSIALAEVKRYAMKPSEAMSYYIGKLEILKLREEYKNILEKRYDLRLFHDRLLSFGAIPLKLIRQRLIGQAPLLSSEDSL